MDLTCSDCDSDAIATMNQQPFCEKHGQEKLEELQSKKEVAEAELEAAEKEYERLQEKYDDELPLPTRSPLQARSLRKRFPSYLGCLHDTHPVQRHRH